MGMGGFLWRFLKVPKEPEQVQTDQNPQVVGEEKKLKEPLVCDNHDRKKSICTCAFMDKEGTPLRPGTIVIEIAADGENFDKGVLVTHLLCFPQIVLCDWLTQVLAHKKLDVKAATVKNVIYNLLSDDCYWPENLDVFNKDEDVVKAFDAMVQRTHKSRNHGSAEDLPKDPKELFASFIAQWCEEAWQIETWNDPEWQANRSSLTNMKPLHDALRYLTCPQARTPDPQTSVATGFTFFRSSKNPKPRKPPVCPASPKTGN